MTDSASPQLLSANVFHGRNGQINNRFTYKADYILLPVTRDDPLLTYGLTRNKFGLLSLNDRDIGDGKSSFYAYAQDLVDQCKMPSEAHHSIELLTMPSFLGYSFNPISFWLFKDAEKRLRAYVVEVTNVGRDRHSYLCKNNDFAPIQATDTISATKCLHVSPFQNLDGGYEFSLDMSPKHFSIKIKYASPTEDGVVATLSGALCPATTRNLLMSAIRLPFGALRVMALIHWQALKLKIKGAKFRRRPRPPEQELSQ